MPEQVCRGCGARVARTLTTLDAKGRLLREECPSCKPELFAEPVRDPSDNKIYTGPQVFPHLYRPNAEGILEAKDELIQDTVSMWDKGPTQQAIDRKRATRRTEPLSATEIEAAQQWGEQCLKPLIQQSQSSASSK